MSAKEKLLDIYGKQFTIQQENSRLFWQSGMQFPVLLQEGKAWVVERDHHKQLRVRMIASEIPKNALFNYVQYNKEGGYLFLGTDSKGIYIIHQSQLITKQPEKIDINKKNSFYSQIELPDGNIVTNEGEIIGDPFPRKRFGFGSGFINSVFSLNDSLLIFCQRDCMFLYNKYSTAKKLMLLAYTYENFSLAFSGGQLYFISRQGIGFIKNNSELSIVKQFDKEKYGDPFDGTGKAFNNFNLIMEVGNNDSAKINTLRVSGFLTGWKLDSPNVLNLTTNYDFYHNSSFQYGAQSINLNWLAHVKPSKKTTIETQPSAGVIILAAVPDEYLYYGEGRNYDYGPGFNLMGDASLYVAEKLAFGVQYRGGWFTTLNGNSSTHFLNTISSYLKYSFTKHLSIGAEWGRFNLQGNYRDYNYVSRTYPYLRVSAGYKFEL